MRNTEHEFSLTNRAKLTTAGIVLLFGLPILYASFLQFQSREPLMGILMIALFILFIIVLTMATGYKIKIADTTLYRESLLGSNSVKFSDIEAINFGSSWTNFHVQSDGTKIFVTKDFENHEQIIRHILDKIESAQKMEEINLVGEAEMIEQYTEKRS